MAKFKNKENGRVWEITNAEHLKHFRKNPRFVEIKEEKGKNSSKSKKEETTEK